jgi:hypothetical protein
MGCAGAGDERKCGGRLSTRHPRCFAVGSSFVEGATQGTTIGVGNNGVIEPFHAAERRGRRQERPFAIGRIGDRETRDLAAGIVARQQAIADSVPAIIALGVGRGEAGQEVAPPCGRLRFQRIELDGVANGAFALATEDEGDRRLAIEIR